MHKLVSHSYFMDEMHIIDVNIMTRYIEYSDVLEWAHTRQIMLCQLKPYLKRKTMTAQDLLPLPIDEKEEDNREKTTSVSNEQLEMLKQAQEYYKKQKDSK